MNKKDISMLRKEFKPENETRLRIGATYNFYCKKDSQSVIFTESNYFDNMDTEKQELLLKNFKKLLPSSLDTKLFELSFVDSGKQKLLCKANSSSNFESEANEIVEGILNDFTYETDILVSFVKAEYFKPTKKKNNDEDAGEDDTAICFEFMMCSINKIDLPKKSLKLDVTEQEVKADASLDVIVNLNPLEGFMFPVFSNNCSDVNKVMYFTSKANKLNERIIENVLGCNSEVMTAQQEKDIFGEALKTALGEKTTPELIHNVYDRILQFKNDCEEDTPIVSSGDIERILKSAGVEDSAKVKSSIKSMLGEENFDFKIDNIVSQSKSIKINSENIDILLSANELSRIKQVRNKQGKKCIMIEIDESVNIEGFELETESI